MDQIYTVAGVTVVRRKEEQSAPADKGNGLAAQARTFLWSAKSLTSISTEEITARRQLFELQPAESTGQADVLLVADEVVVLAAAGVLKEQTKAHNRALREFKCIMISQSR